MISTGRAALLQSVFFGVVVSATRIAVVQHAPASCAECTPAMYISANLALYSDHLATARQMNASFAVFPEFGLFEANFTKYCGGPTVPTPFCEPLPALLTRPCTDAPTSIAGRLGCLARDHGVAVSVNLCELGSDGKNYNTQILLDDSGLLLARYQKMHPYFTSCFAVPPTLDTTIVNITADLRNIGIFTCFDIAFSQPVSSLLAANVTLFAYSASYPIIGVAAAELFSKEHDVTIMASNLAFGESAVYARGTRLTPAAPKTGAAVLVADLV